MKKCGKCGLEKQESEFYRDVRYKGEIRYRYACKSCMNKGNLAWARNNPEAAKAIQDRCKDKMSAWHKKNHAERSVNDLEYVERRRRNNREYRSAHPDKIKAYSKEYAKRTNGAADKKYRANHPERVKAHSQNRRAKIIANGGTFTPKEWIDLCDSYGNICLRCGEKKKLTVDHVIPLDLGGSNFIWNIQPLCLHCNTSKGTNCYDYRIQYT